MCNAKVTTNRDEKGRLRYNNERILVCYRKVFCLIDELTETVSQ